MEKDWAVSSSTTPRMEYSGAMSKGQDKKRTVKTNKPKLTAKEKKEKKLAKKGK